jgi:hypothetical protein
MTTLNQTFAITTNRLKSIKVENLSLTGDTYKQIIYLCLTGNPNAVSPATPLDLCVNQFINQLGVAVDYTYIQRGDLNTVNIVSSNRITADVEIDNTTTHLTEIAVVATAETGSLNVSASNPLCFELLVMTHY